MARKSDSRPRPITATKASRSFASILDQVERGRRFVVRRRGRDVCLMSPPETDPRTGFECLALLRGRARVELDDRFGKDLTEIVTTEPSEDRPSWGS
jgi:hypothetical protein